MPQPTYKESKARNAERQRRIQERMPKPWWWFKQRDPVARFTLYVGIFTLCLVIVGILQWCSVRGQLGEMKTASSLMQSQLDEMKSAGEQTASMVVATQNLASSANTANTIATNADRPWIGVIKLVPNPNPPQIGQEWKTTIRIINSGRSPAIDVRVCFTSGSDISQNQSESSIKKIISNVKECIKKASIVILPNMETGISVKAEADNVTQEAISAINKGNIIWVVIGIINYWDAFGSYHETLFCGKYVPELSGYVGCPTGNKAT